MYVTLDFIKDREEELRKLLADYGIEIQHYEEVGPGGGNPCFHLLVDGYEAHLALINFYYGVGH